MSRTTPEWIGKNDDQHPPPRVRVRVFNAHEGRCQCGCGRLIEPGEKWELDHKVALIHGGGNCESNLQPLLRAHHKKKTRDDIALKTYNYKRRLAHLGIKKKKYRPIPGSRNTPWQVTFSRGIVRR